MFSYEFRVPSFWLLDIRAAAEPVVRTSHFAFCITAESGRATRRLSLSERASASGMEMTARRRAMGMG